MEGTQCSVEAARGTLGEVLSEAMHPLHPHHLYLVSLPLCMPGLGKRMNESLRCNFHTLRLMDFFRDCCELDADFAPSSYCIAQPEIREQC